MAESKLRSLSVDFAVQILNLVKYLKNPSIPRYCRFAASAAEFQQSRIDK